jgi:hypothetical protein
MIDNGREGAIRARAYQLWIESGYADGYQEAHWRQAEQELADKGEVREFKPVVRPSTRDTRHVDGMSLYPSVLDPAPAAAA